MNPKQAAAIRFPGEHYTASGRLLITARQLMALNALLDTPEAAVGSIAEWHRLVRRYDEYLHRDSVYRLPVAWVRVIPCGRRVGAVLQPRGRAILDGQIPMHVRGEGEFDSVKAWLGRWRTS